MSNRNLILAAAGQIGGDYEISRSLRFNSADTAHLTRTPSSAGDQKTWTLSFWIKRGIIDASYRRLFQLIDGTKAFSFQTDAITTGALHIQFSDSAYNLEYKTAALFRDNSAWYHMVLVVDTTQASSANAVKLYVNGVSQTLNFNAISGSYAQDILLAVNSTSTHYIGVYSATPTRTDRATDGYLADINFVDGAALTADSFGEVNEITGVWKPIAYAGTYGTNGFYLDFSDNTSTTTLGYDAAGSNDWTLNNFSVTAGAGNDSLVDSPTRYGTDTGAGGEVRGNYCTLNPLNNTTTLSNGNLQSVSTADDWYPTVATFGMSSGKWYWEIVMTAQTAYIMIGIVPPTFRAAVSTYPGVVTGTGIGYFNDDGDIFTNGNGSRVSYGAGYTVNDVIGVALDMDAGTLTFYKNGASQGTAATGLTGTYLPAFGNYQVTAVANFGQRPFAHTAPSGFKALVTTNLPDPTVVQGDDYFNTVLYTGNGTAPRAITGVGFQPDFVWTKSISNASNNVLVDAVRGGTKILFSELTDAEITESGINSFDSDGYTLGATGSGFNSDTRTYVSWNWKANGAGVSNTAGDIPSTVSANQTAGISIVTYTGDGNVSSTVGHGLGVIPAMIIVKARGGTTLAQGWMVKHKSVPATQQLLLNSTLEATNAGSFRDGGIAYPTSSTTFGFLTGTTTADSVNESGATYVAYCFAEVEGFSKFGSFVGAGGTDNSFIYCGFRPAWVVIKRTDSTSNWFMHDSKRSPYNVAGNLLRANLSDAELSPSTLIDILSNGFKLRDAGFGSGESYIFMAFSSNPFKTSLAR